VSADSEEEKVGRTRPQVPGLGYVESEESFFREDFVDSDSGGAKSPEVRGRQNKNTKVMSKPPLNPIKPKKRNHKRPDQLKVLRKSFKNRFREEPDIEVIVELTGLKRREVKKWLWEQDRKYKKQA
jgi:hypothetical protein